MISFGRTIKSNYYERVLDNTTNINEFALIGNITPSFLTAEDALQRRDELDLLWIYRRALKPVLINLFDEKKLVKNRRDQLVYEKNSNQFGSDELVIRKLTVEPGGRTILSFRKNNHSIDGKPVRDSTIVLPKAINHVYHDISWKDEIEIERREIIFPNVILGVFRTRLESLTT